MGLLIKRVDSRLDGEVDEGNQAAFLFLLVDCLARFFRGGGHVFLRKTKTPEFVNLAVRDGLLVVEPPDELGCLGIAEVGRDGRGDVVFLVKDPDVSQLPFGRGRLPFNPVDDVGSLLLRSHRSRGREPLFGEVCELCGRGHVLVLLDEETDIVVASATVDDICGAADAVEIAALCRSRRKRGNDWRDLRIILVSSRCDFPSDGVGIRLESMSVVLLDIRYGLCRERLDVPDGRSRSLAGSAGALTTGGTGRHVSRFVTRYGRSTDCSP